MRSAWTKQRRATYFGCGVHALLPLVVQHLDTQHVLLALQHCHARGVAHRDVKLENMLLTEGEPPHACLCDFGFATTADALGMLGGDALHDGCVCLSEIKVPIYHATIIQTTKTRTPPYMAPQLLDPRNKAHSPAAADVWAAGVLLCAMLLGRFPYDHAARRGPSDAQLDIYCQQHLRHWSDLPELQAPLATVCGGGVGCCWFHVPSPAMPPAVARVPCTA